MDYFSAFRAAQEREKQAAAQAAEQRKDARLEAIAQRLNLKTFVESLREQAGGKLVSVDGSIKGTKVTPNAKALYDYLLRDYDSKATNAEIGRALRVAESVVIGALAELEYEGIVSVCMDDAKRRRLLAMPQ